MGVLADVRRWFSEDLDREPRGGRWPWLLVGMGGLAAAYGLAGLVVAGQTGHFLPLGVAFLGMGAADLVPAGRVDLARHLRLLAWAGFLVYAAWVFGLPLLSVGRGTQLAAVAGLLLLLGYGLLLYRIVQE